MAQLSCKNCEKWPRKQTILIEIEDKERYPDRGAGDMTLNRTNSFAGVSHYDAQDRMTTGSGMSFVYDLNGSQTNRIINGQFVLGSR